MTTVCSFLQQYDNQISQNTTKFTPTKKNNIQLKIKILFCLKYDTKDQDAWGRRQTDMVSSLMQGRLDQTVVPVTF